MNRAAHRVIGITDIPVEDVEARFKKVGHAPVGEHNSKKRRSL